MKLLFFHAATFALSLSTMSATAYARSLRGTPALPEVDKGQQDYIVKDAVVGAAASVVTGGNAVQGAVGGVVGGVVTHSYAGAAAGGVINGGGRQLEIEEEVDKGYIVKDAVVGAGAAVVTGNVHLSLSSSWLLVDERIKVADIPLKLACDDGSSPTS